MGDYASVADLKARFDNKADTKHDTALGEMITAAEFKINGFCQRGLDGFLADVAASARVYAGNGGPVQFIDECVEITAVAVKTTTNETSYAAWASTDWQRASGDPRRPNFSRTPYTFITILPTGSQTGFLNGHLGQYGVPTVQVTARWGYADEGSGVLALLKEATVAQTMRWFQRFKSGFSDTLAGPEFSQLLFRQALDPDIKDMLVNGGLVRPADADGAII